MYSLGVLGISPESSSNRRPHYGLLEQKNFSLHGNLPSKQGYPSQKTRHSRPLRLQFQPKATQFVILITNKFGLSRIKLLWILDALLR